MANEHMERYSTSQIIKEIRTKTPMRYHLTPVRMVVIKNNNNNRIISTGEDVEKWNPCELLVGL